MNTLHKTGWSRPVPLHPVRCSALAEGDVHGRIIPFMETGTARLRSSRES